MSDKAVEIMATAARRQRFERTGRVTVFDPTLTSANEKDEMRAALTALTEAGYVIVPTEPIPDALEAGISAARQMQPAVSLDMNGAAVLYCTMVGKAARDGQ